MQKIFASILVLLMLCSCTKSTVVQPEIPQKLPLSKQAEENSEMPEYLYVSGLGNIVPVSKGDMVPIDGFIIDEVSAGGIGDLRISYDELYKLSESNKKYLLSIVHIQEEEMRRADAIIARREAELQEIRDSWWERNKVFVGIGVGVVLGVGITYGTGKLWAEME